MMAAALVFYAWLAQQMDVAELLRLVSDPEVANTEPQRILSMFNGVNVLGGLSLALLIAALVLGATYFAAPLVFFWNWPVLAALLFSLRAVLVNWIAFLGFGLVVIGLALLLGIMIAVFGGILSLALASTGAFVTEIMVMLVSLFFQVLMGAAQWKAFTRVFPSGDSGPSSGTQPSLPATQASSNNWSAPCVICPSGTQPRAPSDDGSMSA